MFELIFIFIIGLFFMTLFSVIKTISGRAKQIKTPGGQHSSYSGLGGAAFSGAVGGAAAALLLSHLMQQHHFDRQTVEEMQQMDYQQLQQFALENDLMQQQQIDELMAQADPYLNPGSDAVVDHYYHGLNQGIDDAYYGGNDFQDFGGGFDGGMDNF